MKCSGAFRPQDGENMNNEYTELSIVEKLSDIMHDLKNTSIKDLPHMPSQYEISEIMAKLQELVCAEKIRDALIQNLCKEVCRTVVNLSRKDIARLKAVYNAEYGHVDMTMLQEKAASGRLSEEQCAALYNIFIKLGVKL